MGGGGKGKSKAPATPDYLGLAKETGAQNRQTANELTAANRPNQYDSRGNSITWSQDANGNWTQRQSVTPELAQAQNQYDWFQTGRSNRAAGALDPYLKSLEAGPMAGYNSADGDNVANALYESVMTRGRKEQARESDALNTQLRNSGLVPGSEAYNRAMQNLMTSQNDANLLASQNATLAGGNEARQIYQAKLAGRANNRQDIGALQTMIQAPYNPTFTGFSGATGYNPTDLMGAANSSFSADMAKTNASNSKKGGLLGAGASLGGSYLGSK